MTTRNTITTAAFFMTLATLTSSASAKGFDKTYDWGNSNFGIKAHGGASGSVNNDGRITMEADGSFTAKLFGKSKKASAVFEGAYGDGKKKMDGWLKLDGITLSTKSKSFNGTATYNFPSVTLFEAKKQFTLWGVPVIVIADVSAGASIGFGTEIDVNGSFQVNDWEWEYEVFGAVGAAGTITAGPGTDLAGVGVYGSITFGEAKLAAVKTFPYMGSGPVKNQLQLDIEVGTFEAGVKAWVAGAEASSAVLEIEGFRKNLATAKL